MKFTIIVDHKSAKEIGKITFVDFSDQPISILKFSSGNSPNNAHHGIQCMLEICRQSTRRLDGNCKY